VQRRPLGHLAVVADRFPAFAEAHRLAPPWEGCCVIHDRAYHAGDPDAEAELSYSAHLGSRKIHGAIYAASA
jgi:hypothetical protein